MKLKRIIKRIIISLVISLILSIFLIYFYSSKISPRLIEYAKIESKRVGIDIISKNISKEAIDILKTNNIFNVEKDNNFNIELIDYNTEVVNKILMDSSKIAVENFNEFKKNEDGLVTKVPMGIITNNVFFENLGPKVPIKLDLNGNVLTSLKTNIKSYGINSALVEISIKIEANLIILVPLRSEEINIVNEVPISIKLVEGNAINLLSNID